MIKLNPLLDSLYLTDEQDETRCNLHGLNFGNGFVSAADTNCIAVQLVDAPEDWKYETLLCKALRKSDEFVRYLFAEMQ